MTRWKEWYEKVKKEKKEIESVTSRIEEERGLSRDKIIADRSRAWEWIITWKTILLRAHFHDNRDQDSRDRRLSHFSNLCASRTFLRSLDRSFSPPCEKNAREMNEWRHSYRSNHTRSWNRYRRFRLIVNRNMKEIGESWKWFPCIL